MARFEDTDPNDRHAISIVGIGAVAAIVLVTVIALAAGYSLEAALTEHNPLTQFQYVAALGTIGSVVASAWHADLPVSATVGSLAPVAVVLARPPGVDTTLIGLNAPLAALVLLTSLGAGLEYSISYPGRVRGVFTRRAVRAGTVVGIVHAVLVLGLRTWLGFTYGAFTATAVATPGNAVQFLYAFGGAFLVGFGATVLAVRYRLATTLPTVGVALAWATYEAWRQSPSIGPSVAMTGLITVYTWLWVVVLWLVAVAATAEWGLRTRISWPG